MLKRLARARVPLGFALAAAVLYLARPSMGTLATGFPIALAGIIFRGAAAGVIRKNAALAQQGPYRMTRNPLYFGSFLLALGFAVMSGSLGAALLLVVPSALICPEKASRSPTYSSRSMRFRLIRACRCSSARCGSRVSSSPSQTGSCGLLFRPIRSSRCRSIAGVPPQGRDRAREAASVGTRRPPWTEPRATVSVEKKTPSPRWWTRRGPATPRALR